MEGDPVGMDNVPVMPPAMTDGLPAPGRRVRQIAEEYRDTEVHHALYLPVDWVPGASFPVIVEYAGNQFGSQCSGRVEDCRLGFHQSGGRGCIWVVMPFVSCDHRHNQRTWWGDVAATSAYCLTNLRRICETHGGDTGAIFLTGFSRGAVACGYVGLHDDRIADTWLAFLPHSHHDGGTFTAEGGEECAARIQGRASFITYGDRDGGRDNSLAGRRLLERLGFPVTACELPDTDHTDAWIERDSPARRRMRAWMAGILRDRPGTYTVSGTVVDARGRGIGGVRIHSGPLHWTDTDGDGAFTLRGLIGGERRLSASRPGGRFTPEVIEFTLVRNLQDQVFTLADT